MLHSLVVSFLLFVVSVFASDSPCQQEVPDFSYHPVQDDCSAYWICRMGTGIKITCPTGHLYDPVNIACDVEENVSCERAISSVKRSGGFVHPDCPATNPKEPVILPHRSDCNKFYICDREVAHEKTCLPGLHFNPRLRVCDYPENAKCSKGFISKEQTLPCSRVDPDKSVLLPHPVDCNRFYVCWKGVEIPKVCPKGLHFNTKLKTCDFPANARCETPNGRDIVVTESVISKAGSTVEEAVGSPSPLCPPSNGVYPVFFRHETNCSLYYMCGNGFAYKFSCPGSLHFNLKRKTCDLPHKAGCVKEHDDDED